jgi:16S rRNA (uracil1498-N3)-methyltransferase
MADRFFSDIALQPDQVVALDPQQSHHLLHVLRAGVGDQIHLFDGGPDEFLGKISGKDRRTVRVEVIQRIARPASNTGQLLVAAPVPKGDRFRFLIEKLTELGVAAYLPLLTKRSANPFTPSLQQKAEQWVIEACKQCGRNSLLRSWAPIHLERFLEATQRIPSRSLACTPADFAVVSSGEESPGVNQFNQEVPAVDWSPAEFMGALLVGPEGGFTVDELALVHRYGWQPLTLGHHVLRIETAAVVGAAVMLNSYAEAR